MRSCLLVLNLRGLGVGTRKRVWRAVVWCGIMGPLMLPIGEDGVHSLRYVGKGEALQCEQYWKGGSELVDHVLEEGVKEEGACFHVGDDGFPQLFWKV